MSENWTLEELEAAVASYIDMREKEKDGIPFTKVSYYRALSEKYGRTVKSFEFRMQNISYVYSLMGRDWVTGLRPASHVGEKVISQIEEIINRLEKFEYPRVAVFQSKVNEIKDDKSTYTPKGSKKPKTMTTTVTQYVRDADVVAWVLKLAKGVCECCESVSPFEKDDGSQFLEVHHLRRLADGGSDTTTNAVAMCPNCHREMHYGKNRKQLLVDIYAKVKRLVAE